MDVARKQAGLWAGVLWMVASGVQAHTPAWCGQGFPTENTTWVCEDIPNCRRDDNPSYMGAYYLSYSQGSFPAIMADCETIPHEKYSWAGYTVVFAGCGFERFSNHLRVRRFWDRHKHSGTSSNLTCTPDGQHSFYSNFYWSTNPDEGRNDDPKYCPLLKGNPFHVKTGTKFQTETDITTSPMFARHYSSSVVRTGGRLGKQWNHSYDAKLVRPTFTDAGNPWIFVYRPAGGILRFEKVSGIWTGPLNEPLRLTEQVDGLGATTGYTVTSPDQRTETYDAQGRWIGADYLHGRTLSLTYNLSGLLDTVSDEKGRTLTLAYDGSLRLASVTAPDGGEVGFGYDVTSGMLVEVAYPDATPLVTTDNPTREYHYEETGFPYLLTGITDEQGQRIATWDYDANKRVILSTHGNSASLVDRHTVVYGTPNTTVTDPLGQTISYGSSNQQKVWRISTLSQPCSSCGGTSAASTTYDANGYTNTTTDFNGVVTDYDYNARGQVTQVIEAKSKTGVPNPPEKRTTQTDWHSTLNVPTERRVYNAASTLVAKTAWTYDAQGQVLTQTLYEAGGSGTRSTTTAYCDATDVGAPLSTCPILGLIKSMDGPLSGTGDQITYAYYPSDDLTGCSTGGTCHRKGDLHTVTNGLSQVVRTVVRYDEAGRVVEELDANGVSSVLAYDPRGRMVSRTTEGPGVLPDSVWGFDHDLSGNLVETTDPEGVVLTYTYDAVNRLTGVEDAEGNTVTYTLDAASNRTVEEVHDASTTLVRKLSRVYNTLGRLTQTKNAQNDATVLTYDSQGRPLTQTDPNSKVSNSAYDGLGRVIKTIQDAGGIAATSEFTYDPLDRLVNVEDPNDLDTVYTYNGFGDLVTQVSPDTGTTTFTYDTAGRMSTRTDARSITTTYGYDSLGRLTDIDYPSSSPDRDETFSYDDTNGTTGCAVSYPVGRLTRMTDESGTTTWCYDHQGKVIERVEERGLLTFTTAWTYDLAGRVTSLTYPSGHTVLYTHDALGRIETVVHDDGVAPTTLVDTVTSLPFGPVAGFVFPGAQTVAYAYDQNYWLVGVDSPALDLDFDRDSVGNLVEMTSGTLAEQRVFELDGLYRITGVEDGTAAALEAFTYDDTGNRLSKTVGAGSPQVYGYAVGTHRLTSVGAAPRTYDAAGSLLTEGGKSFVHDDRQRMVQVSDVGGVLMASIYNGQGQRVIKAGAAGTEHFIYGLEGEVLGWYDATGQMKQDVVWMSGRPVGIKQGASVGIPYAGDLLAVHSDQLGTPRSVVRLGGSPANQVVWHWAWGEGVFGEGPVAADPDGDSVVLGFALRFPGQWLDSETGLHYNYFRDYDPGVGRYVQSDPIGLGGGLHTYAYVSSRPLSMTDSMGLCECDCPGGSWQEEGVNIGISVAFGGIFTATKVKYRCSSKSDTTAEMTSTCIGGGIVVGIGIGGDLSPLGKVFNTNHCTGFKDWAWNFYSSAGPYSGTSGFSGGGSVSISKSWGGGLGFINCKATSLKCSCSGETNWY